MSYRSTRRRLLGQAAVLLSSLLLLGAWSLPARTQTVFSLKRIHTDLCNFDLRVPPTPTGLPINDLVIVIYGIFPGGVGDVVHTYPNPLWGMPKVRYVPAVQAPGDLDPRHAGYGFDQLIVHYGWREDNPNVRPAEANKLMHFGVHLRPCRWHVHVEAWWTSNGQRVARAWLCHIYKVWTPNGWVIRVTNPRAWDGTDGPVMLHSAQYFIPKKGLPHLEDLVSGIKPTDWGADGWTPLREDIMTVPIEPDQALSFFIPGPENPPPVFQIQMEALSQTPGVAAAADQLPPAAIVTDRAAVQLEADLNGDGAVGLPDFNLLRSQYGKSSPDEQP